MTTNFDTSLDSFTRPTDTDPGNDGSATDATVLIDNLMDAIEALEGSVGVSGSAVTTTLRYLLSNTSGGHDHDGADSKTVTYANLASIPSTFAPATHAFDDSGHSGTLAFNSTKVASFHQVGRLSADCTFTSTTTIATAGTSGSLANLSFSIGASEVWAFRLVVYVIGLNNTTTQVGWKTRFSLPASATVIYGATAALPASNSSGGVSTSDDKAYQTGDYAYGLDDTGSVAVLEGTVTNSTNAGTVQFQSAQNVSNGTGTTFKAGSVIIAERVA